MNIELFLKNKFKRIVIKVGSSLLIKNKRFNFSWLNTFAQDIKKLKKNDKEVIIVTSGAVSLGMNYLKIKDTKVNLNMKQVCAACGQVILMNNFMETFKKNKQQVAQILLTYSDTEDRKKSLNSRETINGLLELDVLPIINENDSVATDELKFGDNDRLAARVAQISGADNLILLSDVDGFFDKNPKSNSDAKLIPTIESINPGIFRLATSETNEFGSGGMKTKLEAAQIAINCGCNTLICRGNNKYPITNYDKSKRGTWVVSKKKTEKGLKNWLAGTFKFAGSISIDDGAKKALNKGASILPTGVKKINGNFSRGDIIEILDVNGKKNNPINNMIKSKLLPSFNA